MESNIEVLLAVYNGEKFIEEQIHSILNQSYRDIHIIVRDNASEDNTVHIVQKLIETNPGKITLVRSPINVGVVGNFAALMQHSTAPYVMFSDCDDVWNRNKIEQTLAKMKQIEKTNGKDTPLLVHTDLTVVNGMLEAISPSFWRYSHINPHRGHTLNRLLIQNVITGCTVMGNRALLKMSSPVPEDVVMHDWWLGLIASAFGAIETLNEPTMLYRQHGKNDTGAKKYGFISFFKRAFNKDELQKRDKHKKKWRAQAQELLSRHQSRLTTAQKSMIHDFLKLDHASFFTYRYLMIKNRFYKHGALRNFIAFSRVGSLMRKWI